MQYVEKTNLNYHSNDKKQISILFTIYRDSGRDRQKSQSTRMPKLRFGIARFIKEWK